MSGVNKFNDYIKTAWDYTRPISAKNRVTVREMLSVQRFCERLREDSCGFPFIYSDQYYGHGVVVCNVPWVCVGVSGYEMTLQMPPNSSPEDSATCRIVATTIISALEGEGTGYTYKAYRFGIIPNDRIFFEPPSTAAGTLFPRVMKILEYSTTQIKILVDIDVSTCWAASRITNQVCTGKCFSVHMFPTWQIIELPVADNANCANVRRDYTNSLHAGPGVVIDNTNPADKKTWYCSARISMVESGRIDDGNGHITISHTKELATGLSSFCGNGPCSEQCNHFQPVQKKYIDWATYTPATNTTHIDSHLSQWYDKIFCGVSGRTESQQRYSFGSTAPSPPQYWYHHGDFPGVFSGYGGLDTFLEFGTSATEGVASTVTRNWRTCERYLGAKTLKKTGGEAYVSVWDNELQRPVWTHVVGSWYELGLADLIDTPPNWYNLTLGFRLGTAMGESSVNEMGNCGRLPCQTTYYRSYTGGDTLVPYRHKAPSAITTRKVDLPAAKGSTEIVLQRQNFSVTKFAGAYTGDHVFTLTAGGGSGTPLQDKWRFENSGKGTFLHLGEISWGAKWGGAWTADTVKITKDGKTYKLAISGVSAAAVESSSIDLSDKFNADMETFPLTVRDPEGFKEHAWKCDKISLHTALPVDLAPGDDIILFRQMPPDNFSRFWE